MEVFIVIDSHDCGAEQILGVHDTLEKAQECADQHLYEKCRGVVVSDLSTGNWGKTVAHWRHCFGAVQVERHEVL